MKTKDIKLYTRADALDIIVSSGFEQIDNTDLFVDEDSYDSYDDTYRTAQIKHIKDINPNYDISEQIPKRYIILFGRHKRNFINNVKTINDEEE